MMNRPSSIESFIPSIMSSSGLEASSQKQEDNNFWDYEATTQTLNNQQGHPFFTNTQYLDCTTPLPPMANFPFYSPLQTMPTYQQEELVGVGGQIGLNLGRRTYFSSGDALALGRLWGRSRGGYAFGHHPPPRCQADGCGADLSGSKHYHRRHKVCEFHSKAPVVLFAGGVQQRFCQQCSRFHVLSEFDETKRSCRKRLADHNRRRRKPKPQPSTSSSSAPKNSIASSSDKNKPSTSSTRDISTGKAGTKTELEAQQVHQKKELSLRNEPALSLGGVGRLSHYNNSSNVTLSERNGTQHHQLQNNYSNDFFHSQSLFCSSSNEASQSTGEVSEMNPHHHSSLLQLGQAMFNMDFI